MKCLIPLFVLACFTVARGEDIKVATYNIEQWATNFEGHRMQLATRKSNESASEQLDLSDFSLSPVGRIVTRAAAWASAPPRSGASWRKPAAAGRPTHPRLAAFTTSVGRTSSRRGSRPTRLRMRRSSSSRR